MAKKTKQFLSSTLSVVESEKIMELEIPSTTFIHYQDDKDNKSSSIINMPSCETMIDAEIRRYASRDLLDDQKAMKTLCVPLHNAVLRGDWDTTKSLIGKDRRLLTSCISFGGQTVLHHAAGTHNVHFVTQLLEMLSIEDLELRDNKGNTALVNAVASAPIEIAMLIMDKNPNLVAVRGGGNVLPLYMAALFKRSEMAWYIYEKTLSMALQVNDQRDTFFACINAGIFDLALNMLKCNPDLATARDVDNKTALHILALTPSAFESQSSSAGCTKIFKSYWAGLNNKSNRNSRKITAIELVKCLWDEVLNLGHENAMRLTSSPSQLLFDATKLGNFEFLQVLLISYPDLVWEHDSENRTIFHFAVKYRRADIFNMIHDIGSKKEILSTYEDSEKNNMLHLAAMLPTPNRLNIVSGAALQMQEELSWFKEVRNNITVDEKKTNRAGLTPKQLFSVEHIELRKQGEKLLKDTSHWGLIVSTIITMVMFASVFSLPGGNINDFQYSSFVIFYLLDGLAMVSSIVAGMMFLSILTSRYVEEEFLNALPLKLMIGLTSLFLSMLTMMIAFSSTIAIACHDKLKWVSYLVSTLSCVPIVVFVVLQFPLWFDTLSSKYRSRAIFRPHIGKCIGN